MDRFHTVWSEKRLTRKQQTSKPDHLWPELKTKLRRNAQLKERQKRSHEKPKLDNARKLRGIYSSGSRSALHHVAGKGDNSLQHYNLVHKLILTSQAMKIPAAKAAVDKEWEKLEKIPAWNLTKVRSKKGGDR